MHAAIDTVRESPATPMILGGPASPSCDALSRGDRMPTITPSLWFDTDGEEAAEFYVSVFPNSQVRHVSR